MARGWFINRLRTLGAHSNHQPNRIGVCNDSPEDEQNEILWQQENHAGHDVQISDNRSKELAEIERL